MLLFRPIGFVVMNKLAQLRESPAGFTRSELLCLGWPLQNLLKMMEIGRVISPHVTHDSSWFQTRN